jgi:hypothetical protein
MTSVIIAGFLLKQKNLSKQNPNLNLNPKARNNQTPTGAITGAKGIVTRQTIPDTTSP